MGAQNLLARLRANKSESKVKDAIPLPPPTVVVGSGPGVAALTADLSENKEELYFLVLVPMTENAYEKTRQRFTRNTTPEAATEDITTFDGAVIKTGEMIPVKTRLPDSTTNWLAALPNGPVTVSEINDAGQSVGSLFGTQLRTFRIASGDIEDGEAEETGDGE